MALPGLLRRHRDLLLAVAVTMLYAVEILVAQLDRAALVMAVAAVGGVGLALRRARPLAAFLLVGGSIATITNLAPGFDNDSSALVVTFFVALYSVGRHARGVEVWLGAAAVVVFAVLFVLSEIEGQVDSGDVGFAVLFVGTPWGAGLALRLRQEREATLRQRNLELQREQEARALEAVAAERARIARELHDVVSHAIAVTVLQSRGARKLVGVDDPAVHRALGAIDETNTQALSDMRRLLSLLRDAEDGHDTSPQPSLGRVQDLVGQVRASGLPVELVVTGSSDGVPPGVDLSAYRIVQEALTNVLQHAGPHAKAHVEVRYGVGGLEVKVADDGRPAHGTGRNGTGHGLIGIRERVAVAGGEVEAGPHEDGGFVVRARLPYSVEQA